ncbi:MAG: AAA family ATPase [Sphingomonas sp.]|jgi:hypothetical protein
MATMLTQVDVPRPASGGYKVDISRGERIGRVSSEWFSRPDDERFLSLAELHAAVKARAERATTRTVETREVRVEASRDNAERLALIVPGRDQPVTPTHWSFGQLASLVGAPAGYLRQLPASLAGINMQHGLLSHRAELMKTLETEDGRVELRAVTGPDYGRIWDHELVAAVMKIAGNGAGDTRWKVPGLLDWSTMTYNPLVDITKDTTTLYTVRGAALSGIAAENLEGGSGIASRTIASLEHAWARDYDRLTSRDVLVVDEAAMVGTRQLQRVLAEAASGGAKVVMVGDVQQLQAIEAGAAFRLLAERHGAAEISEVRRQSSEWMREATKAFANGGTGTALAAYSNAGMVHAAETRDAARTALIDRWDAERRAEPGASRIILTHMNKEVAMLNDAARARLAAHGALGADVAIRTERGPRQFADNDRILFLRNERDLGVKNGTLGTVEKAAPDALAVRLDDGRRITVDLKSYAHVDHGYAATVHKTQGMTVDRTHVLATPGLDAHASYVALSRHRQGTALHYGRDDFADEAALRRTLGRERPKDMALDYRDGASQRGTARQSLSTKAGQANDRVVQPAQTDRAATLRAMVAARVNAPKHTAETMRDALSKAADALTGLGRGRDRGAER